jgi:protein disulfide-isomerase A6
MMAPKQTFSPTSRWSLLLLIVFLAQSRVNSTIFKGDGQIKEVTLRNYEKEVQSTKRSTLVKYYAPWCGHCQQLAPEYQRASKVLDGLITVAAVDCDQEKQLCAEQGIKGFPTLKMYYTNPRSKKRITVSYEGQRKAKDLIDFARSRIPNFVKQIGPQKMSLDAFLTLAEGVLPKLIVVRPPSASKKPTSSVLKSLAIDYHYRVVFGEIHAATAEDPVYSKFVPPTSKVPRVIMQTTDGSQIDFTEEQSLKALRQFLDKYAPKKEIDPTTVKKVAKNDKTKGEDSLKMSNAKGEEKENKSTKGAHEEL